jgi:hypothetical protein
MKSHFTLSNRIVEFTPPSATKQNRGSHVKIGSRAALALAVSGASVMLTGACYGQYAAADTAAGPTYSGGWSAGQNGDFGFGAWNFNGTVNPGGTADPGAQQAISNTSSVGTAWTLFNLGSEPSGSGISDVGRSIVAGGGLLPGQSFYMVMQNPTAYHFFGGFDILFNNATDNDPAGVNTAAIRAGVFNYGGNNWGITDANGGHNTTLSGSVTGAAGMQLSLTIFSATAYGLTLTPLSNPSAAYTYYGTYSGPINYVNFREYDGTANSSPTDAANNLEINEMFITSVPEPASFAVLSGLGATGLLFFRRRK